MSEQPAASINCGYSDDGLPIGLQIIGRRFDDLGVLGLAGAFENMRARKRGPGPSRLHPTNKQKNSPERNAHGRLFQDF